MLLLTLSELHLYGPIYNLSSDAWGVGDANKPAGRILIDPSNPKGEGWPLNTPEVKAAAEERYGKLTLPTIKEIVFALLAYAKGRGYDLKDMRLFKLDISNAFGCLPVAPELAPYMMIRIGDLLMLHINNQFGPTVWYRALMDPYLEVRTMRLVLSWMAHALPMSMTIWDSALTRAFSKSFKR